MSTLAHSRCVTPVLPPPATVLLVDPEALYRWFVAESLYGCGCGVEVVPCASLAEAAHVLPVIAAPDLLMIDGELLEGRGAPALHAIRALAGAAPCVVLDSGGDLGTVRRAPVTIAAKPVDIAAVVGLVTSQLVQDVPA